MADLKWWLWMHQDEVESVLVSTGVLGAVLGVLFLVRRLVARVRERSAQIDELVAEARAEFAQGRAEVRWLSDSDADRLRVARAAGVVPGGQR